MNDMTVKERILEQLGALSQQDQERVLHYASSLSMTREASHRGAQLLRFSGAIEKTDLEVIERAIDQRCEVVDGNEPRIPNQPKGCP